MGKILEFAFIYFRAAIYLMLRNNFMEIHND